MENAENPRRKMSTFRIKAFRYSLSSISNMQVALDSGSNIGTTCYGVSLPVVSLHLLVIMWVSTNPGYPWPSWVPQGRWMVRGKSQSIMDDN